MYEDLKEDIKSEVGNSWQSGRKLFRYRLPDCERAFHMAIELAVEAAKNGTYVEFIHDRVDTVKYIIASKYGEMPDTLLLTSFEQSFYRSNPESKYRLAVSYRLTDANLTNALDIVAKCGGGAPVLIAC